MLRAFRLPIGWTELARRTATELVADDCLNLAAQLAYYFFLALFPALLFLVALVSFVPIHGLLNVLMDALARVAPGDVIAIVQDQVLTIAHNKNGGLLTLGVLGAIWSTSSGVSAIIDTLNAAYDIRDERPWWRVKLVALGLTLTLAVFIVVSFVLVLAGPTLAERIADHLYLGPAFVWSWKILQWPFVFMLVSLAMALVFYFAPDAEQQWLWIVPGAVLSALLWILISLAFKFYVAHFTSYNATYGAIGGVIVLLLWFYVSSLAVLIGAELNAEIEHASPYGKDRGEKTIGDKKMRGMAAARARDERKPAVVPQPRAAASNCDIDAELAPPSASDFAI